MLEVPFSVQGLFRYEFIPERRAVYKEPYVEIFRRLTRTVKGKYPERWAGERWFLLHDNAPILRWLKIKYSLTEYTVTVL
jgi:hypothetical protein